jgi:hypothetical protein
VKTMPALAYYDRTVIARELAFATGAFEVHAADTAGVVGLFGQIPFPGGDGFEGVDGDFHCGDWRGCRERGSCEINGSCCRCYTARQH